MCCTPPACIGFNSQLLVVGSQIVNLTPGFSFCYNLCYRCPNGSCKPIFDIYTSIAFQLYRKLPNARFFGPCDRTLKFWESQRTPKSPFRECESHPHFLKVRLRHSPPLEKKAKSSLTLIISFNNCNYFLLDL